MPGIPLVDYLNSLSAGHDAKWGQSSLINVLNTMNGANTTGLGLGISAFDPARNQAMAGGSYAQNLLNSPAGGLGAQQQSIQDYLGGLGMGAFTQSGLQGRNGANLDYVANSNANAALRGQNGNDTGSQSYSNLLGSNGQVNGGQQASLDELMNLLGGGGTNGDLKAGGIQATANGGLNGYDSRLQSLGDYFLSRGGYDDNLNTLAGAGKNTLQSNGLTQAGNAAQGVALGGVQNGGQTDTTRALQGIGTNFAGQQALLPAALAAGFAKDQAGGQASKSAENFQAQALARGGGAGSTVANGAQNAGMADFANTIAESQANAYQNSLVQQQGLNLQQQGQGAQMALGAGNLAAGQLGTYGNLLTGQQNVQNQANQIGGNQLAAAAAGANNQAGTYGNLGVQGGQLGNQTLGLGLGALNNVTGNQTAAAQGINGLSQTQLQALLGAGSGLNANAGTSNAAYNNSVNNQLGSGALGNTQGNSYYNQLSNLLGLGNSANQNSLNLNNNSLQALLGLSGQGFNYAQSGLSGQAGLFQNYASTTNNNKNTAQQQFSNSLQSALSGAGGGEGGMGGA